MTSSRPGPRQRSESLHFERVFLVQPDPLLRPYGGIRSAGGHRIGIEQLSGGGPRSRPCGPRGAIGGEWTLETIYSEKAEVTINVKAAEKAGLEIPKEALQRADKVLP